MSSKKTFHILFQKIIDKANLLPMKKIDKKFGGMEEYA
jgi:hypothetical protein